MNRPQRLTWGGLIRILTRLRYKPVLFEKGHIHAVIDGRTKYLNLKYDAKGVPYFVEVKDN